MSQLPANTLRMLKESGTSGEIHLGYGDETQEAWKPLLNMLPVLRGSSEWLAQLESERFLLWLVLTQPLSFAKQK